MRSSFATVATCLCTLFVGHHPPPPCPALHLTCAPRVCSHHFSSPSGACVPRRRGAMVWTWSHPKTRGSVMHVPPEKTLLCCSASCVPRREESMRSGESLEVCDVLPFSRPHTHARSCSSLCVALSVAVVPIIHATAQVAGHIVCAPSGFQKPCSRCTRAMR